MTCQNVILLPIQKIKTKVAKSVDCGSEVNSTSLKLHKELRLPTSNSNPGTLIKITFNNKLLPIVCFNKATSSNDDSLKVFLHVAGKIFMSGLVDCLLTLDWHILYYSHTFFLFVF